MVFDDPTHAVPASEYVHLMLTVVGFVGSLLFTIVSFVVRMEIKRTYAQLAELKASHDVNQRRWAWLKAIFEVLGLPEPPA